MTLPLLIGGATTSKVHTALRIDPAYKGPVIHVLDASRAVGVASALVSDTQREPLIAQYREATMTRSACARASAAARASWRRSRRRAPTASPTIPPARRRRRQRPGVHSFGDWPLRDLRGSIDWTPFFRAWELAGNYPAILEDRDRRRKRAARLFDDAQAMLDRIIAEHWLTPRGTVGLWRCRREGDDVLVLAGND